MTKFIQAAREILHQKIPQKSSLPRLQPCLTRLLFALRVTFSRHQRFAQIGALWNNVEKVTHMVLGVRKLSLPLDWLFQTYGKSDEPIIEYKRRVRTLALSTVEKAGKALLESTLNVLELTKVKRLFLAVPPYRGQQLSVERLSFGLIFCSKHLFSFVVCGVPLKRENILSSTAEQE